MTKVFIRKTKNGDYIGFLAKGHAEFSNIENGDIVCSAISILTQTAINMVGKLGYKSKLKVDEKKALIDFKIVEKLDIKDSEKLNLVISQMELGLSSIESIYPDNICVVLEEE